MAASDVAVGIIFLSQTVVGALGNSCVLLHYLVHHLMRFKAMKISPENSSCTELKVKAPKYIGFSMYLSWILYLLENLIIISHMTGKRSNNNITSIKNYGYCSAVHPEKSSQSLHAALLTFPDVLCVGLMLWASSSMVLILHRHKQRMQHIQKTSSPGPPLSLEPPKTSSS
ncbi:Hypothetical predicted protein, partial [Marmota monax]